MGSVMNPGNGIVNVQLADIAKYLSTPVATYTHTSNREVVVSAVDVGTDTFTSVAHGLVNGDTVCPVLNSNNAALIYPPVVYQTPISNFAGVYYVVNKTNDTFQLSLTAGGGAIDLTVNATLDLTKWHFETVHPAIIISSLPSLQKCRVVIRGKSLLINTGVTPYVLPNDLTLQQTAMISGLTGYTYPSIPVTGSLSMHAEIEIDYNGMLTFTIYGANMSMNNTTTYSTAVITRQIVMPLRVNGVITSLNFMAVNVAAQWAFANGTVVEVYKA
jgi:hypothetical protein